MTGSRLRRVLPWNRWATIGALVAFASLVLLGVLSWQLPFGNQIQLGVGEVAPFDIVAPSQITYESQILTEQARERAAQAVPDQYENPDARVRRQQIERAHAIIDYIAIVRADPFASPELKTDYLLAIADFSVTSEIALQILTATDEEWEAAAADIPLALDRVMRDEIRENGLAAARRRVPTLVNPDLSERANYITSEIVRGLIRPNSTLNVTRTEELRERAVAEVPMIQVTLERNEAIIRAGDLATEESVEALQQIGLMQAEWNWWVLARGLFFTLALVGFAVGALYRLRAELLQRLEEIALLVVVTSLWLIIAKFMLTPHEWLPYLYPLAALSMLLAVLIDFRVSIVATVVTLLVAQYLARNNIPLVAYLGLGSFVGALILGRAERISVFIWAGLGVVVCNILVFAAFRAPFTDFSLPRLLQMLLVVILNGGLSASVALIGYLILGNLFGITTSLQLTELSRPTHPLLRQVLLKASGTYHHTIVVSNMAERAAATIGADAYLTRVGAYYHDIGKTVRPYFFAENIMEGNSPHEKLDPLTSAQIIISHVSDGVDLAQKYRLPERIQDFIREHHGRSLVRYFYVQAQKQAQDPAEVNEEDFRYPGPNPRSKETAILLLADTCEAAVRAIRPSTREELGKLVNRLIDERLAEGELNESNLTFRELQMTKEIFLQILQGVHHPRVQYPEPVQATKSAPDYAEGQPLTSLEPKTIGAVDAPPGAVINGEIVNGGPVNGNPLDQGIVEPEPAEHEPAEHEPAEHEPFDEGTNDKQPNDRQTDKQTENEQRAEHSARTRSEPAPRENAGDNGNKNEDGAARRNARGNNVAKNEATGAAGLRNGSARTSREETNVDKIDLDKTQREKTAQQKTNQEQAEQEQADQEQTNQEQVGKRKGSVNLPGGAEEPSDS